VTTCAKCKAPLAADARFCGECGAAVAPTEDGAGTPPGADAVDAAAIVGREIAGRYRILAQIGHGGMGAVFRAQQLSLKREVALKLLKPELSAEPGLVRRFNAEAELAAKLEHPNTVTLFDFGQDSDGTLFIAMEYVKGVSLREVMTREGPIPAPRALAICEQITASLADAHAHGIIHRDLKPDNIMLTERGKKRDVVRVLDFGIAKLRDERGDVTAMPLTRAGDLLGTPQYMAPEQIRGEKVDGRTDVYALGAMLYEIITGRLPFEAPTLMAILSKHLTELPIAPTSRRPDLNIPLEIERLIMEALQKAPEARPPSMEAFGDRVSAISAQVGRGAHPHASQGGAGAMPGAAAPTPLQASSWAHATPGMPPNAAQEPRRPTRPPGVPLTIPPDLGAARPVTPSGSPAPYAGAPASAPAPTPAPTPVPAAPIPAPAHAAQTPAHLHTEPVPARAPSRSRTGLWVALALVAAVGIAAAILLATTDGKKRDDSPPPEGERWTHPRFGYSVILPPGFAIKDPVIDPSVVAFEGAHNGEPAFILVSGELLGGREPTDDLLSGSADGIVASSGGVMVEKQFRTVQGARRMTGIYDVPLQSIRWSFVIYPHDDMAVVAMFGTSVPNFDSSADLRAEIFERRILLP
jgi:serine/threonine protein kinase